MTPLHQFLWPILKPWALAYTKEEKRERLSNQICENLYEKTVYKDKIWDMIGHEYLDC